MERNIAEGPPDNKFLWPLFMTDKQNGSFGYVMNLRPEELLLRKCISVVLNAFLKERDIAVI
jgi:hypothetical protein